MIGLGRIGKHVVQVARGLGMNIVAYDPFIAADHAKELGIDARLAGRSLRRRRFPDDPHARDRRNARASSAARPSRK